MPGYLLFNRALAEEEGFEPPVPRGTPVFKTGAFDHSATPLRTFPLFNLIPHGTPVFAVGIPSGQDRRPPCLHLLLQAGLPLLCSVLRLETFIRDGPNYLRTAKLAE